LNLHQPFHSVIIVDKVLGFDPC